MMSHSYTNLLCHIIFATKDRQAWLDPALRPELWRVIGGIVRSEDGIALEVNGMVEHVHILAKLPASRAVSDVIRAVKAKSSHWLKGQPNIDQFAWQTGYGAFSVSQSQVEVVWQYVQRQEEHHRNMPFTDEMRKLIRAHGLEVDERLLWE
jgi:REP element-mobilizing transposase RayT